MAEGRLLDVIRRTYVFGLQLTKLDLRQESERHTDAMDTITDYLGLGSYKSWTEDEKVSWIEKELMGRRPLVGRSPPHLQRCFERPALTRPFRDARRFPSPRL